MEEGLYQQGEWRLWFVGNDGCKKVFGGAGSEEQVRAAFAKAVKDGRNAIVVDQLGVKQLPVDESPAITADDTHNWTEQEKFNAAVLNRMQVLSSAVDTLANLMLKGSVDLGLRIDAVDVKGLLGRVSELGTLVAKIEQQLDDSSLRDLVEHLAECVGRISTLQIDLGLRIEAVDKKNADAIAGLNREALEFAGNVGDDVCNLREAQKAIHLREVVGLDYAKSLVAVERSRINTIHGQVDAIVERLKAFPDAVAELNRGDEELVESDSAQSPELVSELPLGAQVRILQYQVCDLKDALAENELAAGTQGKLIKQLQDRVAKLRAHVRSARRKADLW
jgi:hypothetical protein